MKEHIRLQKLCLLGYRLHELGLIQLPSSGSVALATLNHLMRGYQVQRQAGLNLEQTLEHLGFAVMQRHQLHYRFISVDAVLDFFARRFLVDRSLANQPMPKMKAARAGEIAA